MTASTAAAARSPARADDRPAWRRIPAGFLFTVPFLVFYVLFLVWPTISGLWLSFFNASLTGAAGEFVGLANWREVFGDDAVWSSLANTVEFTLFTVPPLIVIALVMALLTARAMPARALWRFAYFAPFLMPSAVIALVWIWLFQPDYGLVNDFLANFGVAPASWTFEESRAMPAVAIATVWWTVGFNYLLYLAAIQAIPRELYEASAIDGAGGWHQFWRITFPLLGRTTGLILILQILASLKVFDQIYLMTAGGPNFSTRPILGYVYDTGFVGFRTGYASAVSYLFFALIVIVSLAQFRFASRGRQA